MRGISRSKEELAAELDEIIERDGLTQQCSQCHLVKPRGDFRTRPAKYGFKQPASFAECKPCNNKRNQVYRRRVRGNKKSDRYLRYRELSNTSSRKYTAKRRAHLDALDQELKANPLSKKLMGF